MAKAKKPATPLNGQFRVWWIPQIPGKPFLVNVINLVEAKLLLDALTEYDLFQFENRIKPDYSNAGGLSVYDADEGEWIDWYSLSEGKDIDEYTLEELRVHAENGCDVLL